MSCVNASTDSRSSLMFRLRCGLKSLESLVRYFLYGLNILNTSMENIFKAIKEGTTLLVSANGLSKKDPAKIDKLNEIVVGNLKKALSTVPGPW